MNGREIHSAVYSGEKFDRLPVRSIGVWTEAVERWKREGLTADEDPNRAIGLGADDHIDLPLNLRMYPLFDVEILEKNDTHVVLKDEFHVTKRMLRSDFDRSGGLKSAAGSMSSMSQWLEFPVQDISSWKKIYEERFQPTSEGRVPNGWNDRKDDFRGDAETRWVRHFGFPFGGLFSAVRELMGLEGAIYAMADDPDLVRTIVEDLSGFYLDAFALMIPETRLDQVTCFEDMCSNRAPLLSPAMFRAFFASGYKKYIGGLKDMGVEQVFIDTDGDARLIIPEFVKCGFTGIHPCEIKAGMDPGAIREQFPKLCCNGGIDKVAVARGGRELMQEFERRFRTAWDLGRYTPGLDHLAPPDISWENARLYGELLRAWCVSPTGPI
jgi:hypothetical protein